MKPIRQIYNGIFRTLNESFFFDWGCLDSKYDRSTNTIAKITLVYTAILFLTHASSKGVVALLVLTTQPGWNTVSSPLSHHWWMVATHSCCTVTKLNSTDVKTAKDQTTHWNLKIIFCYYSMGYSVVKRTVQHNDRRGHALGLFVGVVNVGQVKIPFHRLDETSSLWFIVALIFHELVAVQIGFIP